MAAFLAAHDGGVLGPDVRLLSLEECREAPPSAGAARAAAGLAAGLWPVMERGGRRYALDAEDATSDGEWPVVEIGEAGIDRVGTSFLRFVHVVCAELAVGGAAEDRAAVTLGEERCRRDPGHADNWLDLAELLEQAGREKEIDGVLASALRAVDAAHAGAAAGRRHARRARRRLGGGPAWLQRRHRARADRRARRRRAPRRGGARLRARLRSRRRDGGGRGAARAGRAVAATVSFWRGEALTGAAADVPTPVGALALRIVAALEPQDPDIAKLRAPTPALRAALRRLQSAREDLELGRAAQAVRTIREALATPELAALGAAHAIYAEALNATRERGAVEAAEKATALNPYLVDGWRELGDAHLEANDLKSAEKAFRRVVEMDATYGLGFAKLAQVLLEQGRTLEALEAITEAGERGGDPFFIAAIRGDIYAEMERHNEAAEAYDEALDIEPEDHWALHQAALEHGARRAPDARDGALRGGPRARRRRLPPDARRLRRSPAQARAHRRRREALPPRRRRRADRPRVAAGAARRRARAARRAELEPGVRAARDVVKSARLRSA